MPSEILIALLTVGGSLVGSIIGALGSSRLTNYRLEQVEHKVSAIEKKFEITTDITQRLALLEQRVSNYEKAKT